jgi:hypothetical protein
MELEIIMLTEVSQAERQVPHNLTHMWNPKKKKADLIENGSGIVVTRSWGE